MIADSNDFFFLARPATFSISLCKWNLNGDNKNMYLITSFAVVLLMRDYSFFHYSKILNVCVIELYSIIYLKMCVCVYTVYLYTHTSFSMHNVCTRV